MLSVDHYELIRRKSLIENLSIRAISRELGHSRKTIRKVLAHGTPPGYQHCQPVASPVMDKVAPIVDAWLEQDQSGTVQAASHSSADYERLRDEQGFMGSVYTVRRYVSKLKTTRQEVFMPLQFDPGEEAQVDWHTGWIVVNGIERKAQFFCMRLCYSKASLVIAYERADLISFLDGHIRAFAYFGGVPRRLAYDNLKSAVIRVGKGKDRVLNETFKKLRFHYLFDTRFCNVARGNEKGHVENLAKRSERIYLTPLPQVTSLYELNEHLLTCCRKDLELPGACPHQDQRLSALLEEDRRGLIALPAPAAPGSGAFEACERIDTTIDKRSLVTVTTNRYLAPTRWAHHPVRIKVFVDSIDLWCEHERIAIHPGIMTRGSTSSSQRTI